MTLLSSSGTGTRVLPKILVNTVLYRFFTAESMNSEPKTRIVCREEPQAEMSDVILEQTGRGANAYSKKRRHCDRWSNT
jgi:hypothetical protein